tara:strand:- start:835 stop:2379 length:1545 start_codon:yes stop_codon:yes gene_type:complete
MSTSKKTNDYDDALKSLNLDFSTSPVVWDFLNSNSFVRGLIGPVGSGKSYASAAEIMIRAVKQKVSPRDGIRYSRFAIVRNSYPMLRTTTLKTWQELFPEHIWGPIRHAPPITHHLKLPARGKAAGIDCEVVFLALDQPKDVRKLLSLELTGAWVNEARELPKAVIDGLTHRVGRYPVQADGGPSWRGVWIDSNPCDDDHWMYKVAEIDKPKGKYPWTFWRQPGGVIEATPEEVPENMPEAQGYMFACSRWWKQNPKAENVGNLPVGYYEQIMGGKNLDWIRCYAEGKFTFVLEGKPVWPEYDDQIMAADCEAKPGIPIQIGLDFGLTPAAVFAQRLPTGQWQVLHELVTFDMGLERFGHILKAEIESRFPGYDVNIYGDPAGLQRDAIFETTAFDHLKTLGLYAQPCPTNNWRVRREALASPMGRLIQAKPGLLVDKKCLQLRKALAGGYHYKRVQVSGHERFKDTPNKNESSHIGDAAGYCLLGGGEHRTLTRNTQRPTGTSNAALDFDVFK